MKASAAASPPVRRSRRTRALPTATLAIAALGVLTLFTLATSATAAAFDLDDVAAKAEELASKSYEAPHDQVPDWLLNISYDDWREIRFRPEKALWKELGLPFEVQFFHPGLFYDRTVKINTVDAEGVHPVEFSPSQFDYGKSDIGTRVPQDLGYAGLRLHHPIKTKGYKDEVIVFLGASYFRSLGRDQIFGLSARGLAIDTALAKGEEFPWFREFWLVRPARSAEDMAVYALLDSPSLTGAYRFIVDPGTETIVAVEMRLYRRKQVGKLGIAPLTSMFFYGENSTHCFDNYRPEVHDSDGLLISAPTGEWIWRPLENPSELAVSAFQVESPKGFGLLQRDRDFADYQDLETHQEQRPSAWVVPRSDFGKGHVELVEIPTDDDTNDNIVAFWVPAELPPMSQPVEYSYAIYWYGDDSARPPAGRAVATRRESGSAKGSQRIVIDFEGKELAKLPADTVLRGVATVAGGEDYGRILDQQVVKNPATGGWRLAFQVLPSDPDTAVELRAFLDKGGNAMTETWTYTLRP